MTFAAGLRRLTLTTHLTSSVGWLGAVVVFVALAAIGLTSQDERTAEAGQVSRAKTWLETGRLTGTACIGCH
jgi:hypothetical protein